MSLCIFTTPSTAASSQPSIKLSVVKSTSIALPSYVTFYIFANYSVPLSLWTSRPIVIKTKTHQTLLDEQDMIQVFVNIVNSVLHYCPDQKSSFQFPGTQPPTNFKDVFNTVFLSLAFLVCIFAVPRDLHPGCLDSLGTQLTGSRCRDAAKNLVKMFGEKLEDQWMHAMNLAVTIWIVKRRSSSHSSGAPSPLFSHALSTSGLWKVQLYCPVIATGTEETTEAPRDDRLLFSLTYHQVQCVTQLAYRRARRDDWIDVEVMVDNIRCDVDSLVSETLMAERGYGSEEKHFPSRVMLQITPMQQSGVLSISIGKSIGTSVTKRATLAMKAWNFEQSTHGNTATLDWSLHDGINGKEVYSSKPSKRSPLQPRAWFRDRYSNAYRPFISRGGVIFAPDEYGDSVRWKICGATLGETMNWEIRGWIWLTYWPNKQKRTFHSETRSLEFRECLQLPLTEFP